VIKTIGMTASGTIAKEGVTLAMPKEFPFGTKITINGKLLGICQDRGGAIYKDKNIIRIDVYVKSHEEALKLGVKYINVKVKKVENVSGFL
jgi:3D (Asp-Asp-Asp) domain-containing protein